MNHRELVAILHICGIDTIPWQTKKLHTNLWDLAKEIATGESYLRFDASGLSRVTGIVRIRVRHPEEGFLMEKKVISPGGCEKERNCHPGGKILLGEGAVNAAFREFREELNLGIHDLHEWKEGGITIEKHDSQRYPGLPTTLEVHTFDFWIEEGHQILLQPEIETTEADGTKHVFRWEPPQ